MSSKLIFSAFLGTLIGVHSVLAAPRQEMVGARAIGMGGSHVASGRGISGIPYNPASAAFIESSEAYFSSVNYIAGIQHGVLSYGRKMGPSDYVGLHLFYLDSGPMAVTNEYYPDGTGEDFRVVSTAFRTTYARNILVRVCILLCQIQLM